jgi:long-chain acyl-CoA synthetase
MEFVGVYSKNRYEWLIFDWACVLFGLTSVPLYDTLGVENLSYCLKQTEMITVFVSGSNLTTLLKLEHLGNLKNLVLFDFPDSDVQDELKRRGLSFIYYKDLIREG